MPSTSTLTASERDEVKTSAGTNGAKILAAGLARIYFAYPDPNAWAYGGLQGAMVFVHDKSRGIFYLRLVDLVGTRGVLWEHEVYEEFEYYQDRPYFHSFAGDVSILWHIWVFDAMC